MPVFGGVLAERGEHDAVLEGEVAQLEGLEELGNRCVVWLRVGGCSCRRFLRGCKVGDLSALVSVN